MSAGAIDLGARIREAIRIQRKRIKAFEDATATDKPPSQRDFNDAVKVMAQLIGQARALAKDAIRWAGSLSAEQRRDVIVGWFTSLPEQQQRLLLQELTRVFNDERTAAA